MVGERRWWAQDLLLLSFTSQLPRKKKELATAGRIWIPSWRRTNNNLLLTIVTRSSHSQQQWPYPKWWVQRPHLSIRQLEEPLIGYTMETSNHRCSSKSSRGLKLSQPNSHNLPMIKVWLKGQKLSKRNSSRHLTLLRVILSRISTFSRSFSSTQKIQTKCMTRKCSDDSATWTPLQQWINALKMGVGNSWDQKLRTMGKTWPKPFIISKEPTTNRRGPKLNQVYPPQTTMQPRRWHRRAAWRWS